MMLKQASMLALLVALAACTGSSPNPVNGSGDGDDDDGPDPTPLPEVMIPATIAENVTNVTLNPGDPADPNDDTIVVTGLGFDDSPFTATYARNDVLDVDGYQAYSTQDDRLDRIYIGLSATSADGAVTATAVSDGGQFNRFFRGVFYQRLEPLTRPSVNDENGQVSYAGHYAGLTNLDTVINDVRLPLEPGDPPEAEPEQSRQTVGKVFLNVDFSDNRVSGTIYDREFTDGEDLEDLALIDAELDAEGQFAGTAEFSGRPDLGSQGDYGGVLGGADASAVAGGIHLDNIFLPDDPRDTNFDEEVGVFVLPRCGTPEASDICDGLGDLE